MPTPAFTAATPFDHHRIGAAAVYCSDGRYGDQMDEFLHYALGLPRYDRVAVPGGAGCLYPHSHAFTERNALERQLTFLIEAHGLTRVILIAHHDCGFYKHVFLGAQSLVERQASDLRYAADRIRQWCPKVTVEAYFARREGSKVSFDQLPIADAGDVMTAAWTGAMVTR